MASEDNLREIPNPDGESMKNLSRRSSSSPVQEDVYTEEEERARREILGDKVNSKKYVMLYNSIVFLLKLQGTKWKKEWEQQFVTMWNMTKEKEVCDFLFSLDFHHLIGETVETYDEECRLIEILMGILSDIAVALQEDMVMSTDDMKVFLNLFYFNTDSNVLIQTLKFFRQVWGSSDIEIDYDNEEFYMTVLFILVKKSNSELLYEMLSCLTLMCDGVEFSELIIYYDPFFLKHCVKAYKQVYIDLNEQTENGDIFTLRQYNCFYNLMWMVNNVSRSTTTNQLRAAFTLASESLLKETSTVYIFLSRDQETIESALKCETLFVGLLAFLSEAHPVSYQDNLFKSLLKIVINSSKSELPQNSLLDLVLYFICSAENYVQLRNDCLEVGKRRTLCVLENFANIKNKWNFRNKVLCAQNLHRLSHDLKQLLNK